MDIVKKYENFSRSSFGNKLRIKEQGRPLPDMTIEFLGSSRGKNYTRKFNRDIYARNKWICGCNIKNSFFCFPCVLFGGEIKWTQSGIRDLVHLSGRIKTHESSKPHILNQMHLALLGTTNIQAQLDSGYWTNIRKHNEEVTKNRYVLSKIIDCVKFCGAFELALRGHDEAENSDSPGMFRGLIHFSAEIDISLRKQLQKTSVFKGTSEDIQNDLLSCILDIYYEEIAKEVSAAPFISLMADEITDVSAEFQLVVVLRYTNEGVPTERFWGFLLPSGRTAEILTENIFSVIEPLVGSNKDKLIAQSYDGANVMSGRIDGVQTKIKEKFPNAHFIHCYAHQLNLLMGQASSQSSQVRTFFCNIQDIPAFFSNSPQRVGLLNKVVGKKMPSSVPTKWNFKSRTVNVVYEHRESLIECMEEIQDFLLQDNLTVNKAMAIKRMLEDKTFIFWLTFFHHVMPHVDTLYDQLQKRKIDAIEVNAAVISFVENIDNIRNRIDLIVQEVTNVSDEVETVKRKRVQHSYGYNKATAVEVCDLITTVAKDRFEFCGHLIAVSLFVPEKFQDYVVSFPDNELESTVNTYPMLMKQRLRTELSIIYSRHEFRCLKGAVPFLKFLITNNLEDVFPEVKKLLEILVTIPMTTSEAERCFPTLKRIRTFLRNTMTQEGLTALAVLSIEHAFITAIPNFNERVIDKFASKKNRQMDFIYENKKAGESTQKSEPTGSAPLPTSTVLLPEARARVQPSTSTTAPATTDPLIKLEEPSCSRIQEPGIDTTLEFLPEPSEQPVVNVAPKPKPTYKGRKDRIYCRLCLKTSNKNSLTPLSVVDFNYPGKSDAFKKKKAEKVEEIQKMIKFCLPFFDSLTFNPIICSICLARLRSSYDFANECLKNQRLVEKYADMYGATERIININEMVESKFALSEDESESDTDTDNTTQSIPKVTRSSARVSHQKTGEKYSHEDGPATKKQKIYNESQEENSLASSNEDTPCIKTEPHEEDDTILKEFLTQDMPTRDTDPDNIDNIADESMIKIEPEYIDSPDFIKAEPVDDLHVENEIFNKRTGIGTDIQEQHSHFPKTEKDVLDTGTIVPSTTREPVFFNVDSSLETTTSDVN